MAEQAGALDILSEQRLQLGISRGSPEHADRGYEHFGNVAGQGGPAGMAREHTAAFLHAIEGHGIARPNPQMVRGYDLLPVQPQSPSLRTRIWWGAGSRDTAVWAAQQGMQLMSSTLLLEERGIPLDQLQREQLEAFLEAWKEAGWSWRPQTSVSRTIIPLVGPNARAQFASRDGGEGIGYLDGHTSRFGPAFVGTPDQLVERLSQDVALQVADNVLVTIPNQLGVDFCAAILQNIVEKVAPELGWRPKA